MVLEEGLIVRDKDERDVICGVCSSKYVGQIVGGETVYFKTCCCSLAVNSFSLVDDDIVIRDDDVRCDDNDYVRCDDDVNCVESSDMTSAEFNCVKCDKNDEVKCNETEIQAIDGER